MSSGFPFFRSLIASELEALRRTWGWIAVWGALLLLAGVFALIYPAVVTVLAVEVFGFLLLFAAVLQFFAAFHTRGWAGALATILCGVLYAFAGIVLLDRPALGAAGYTLFLAMFFFAMGTVRIASAFMLRYSGWGWSLLNGVISIALAVMIWCDLPGSALWVIGTFIGIELVFAGWSWLMLGFAVRRLPSSNPAG